MTKEEFLTELKERLKGLSKEELDERIGFYSEMIDDRIDEGKTEEEAVAELGGVDKVIDDIIQETPLLNIIKERMKPKKRLRGWEIAFLILGFPLWFPLFLVFIILCLVAYLLVWIGVIVVYSIEGAFSASAVFGLIGTFIAIPNGGLSMSFLGMGLLGLGLACLFIFACMGVTKGTVALSKKIARGIKRSIVGKGA